jgi:hypothetical protein
MWSKIAGYKEDSSTTRTFISKTMNSEIVLYGKYVLQDTWNMPVRVPKIPSGSKAVDLYTPRAVGLP